MSAEAPKKYQVLDRSLLLPAYKRFVVNPALPLIPAKVNPNTITHLGHLINLLGMIALGMSDRSRGAWPFVLAALTLHIYNFCDNADGGHARRTNQCSPMGEFLDHGLDLLNSIYIGAIAAWATGLPPIGTVVLVTAIVGGGATTFWEQAETGTLHLPMMNQIEGVFGISALLLISFIFGPEVYAHEIGPFALRTYLALGVIASGLYSSIGTFVRVQKANSGGLKYMPYFLFGVANIFAAYTGMFSYALATCVGSLGFVFFGIRSLTLRMAGESSKFDSIVAALTALLFAAIAYHHAGGALAQLAGTGTAVVCCAWLGIRALKSTLRCLQLVQAKIDATSHS
jgi:phosphatidylglycerophosphate synthase